MIQVLDTDHMTILGRGGITAYLLELRLAQLPIGEIATTIISYEEQMRGWLSRVAQAKTPQKQVEAYGFLQFHIETYRNATILAFNDEASAEFEKMRQAKIRIGTKDLRIAAICLVNGATLLARNLRHFEQVPALKAEDWSV